MKAEVKDVIHCLRIEMMWIMDETQVSREDDEIM